MKKLLALLSLLVVAVSSFAQTFTVGDITYEVLSSTDKTVKVTNGKNAIGDVVIPETVTYNDEEYSVTTVYQRAFYQNANITSIEMPSVTSIGSSAFYKCSSLSSVSLPATTSIGSDAFNNCASLSSVSLPAATSIGNYAFNNCTSLSSVSLPAATSIGSSAFQSCSSLSSVSLPAAETIGGYAFSECSNINSLRIGSVEQWCNVNFGGDYSSPLQHFSQSVNLYIGDSETPVAEIVVPETVTTIPDYAFRRTTITSFSAPGAETIGSSAFNNCTSLSSISLPTATSIGNEAFSYCTSLSSVSLPAATSIGYAAFYNCTSLSSVSLLTATSIGEAAFYNCTSLSSISLPAATSIGRSAFYYCRSLSSVSLPAATSIGNYAFNNCTSLSSVSLPAVTSIDSYAFYNCTSLSSVSLPTATSIGEAAFNNCTSLSSISLPAATSIGSYAFYYCRSLSSVSLPAATSIGEGAFSSCSKINSLRIGSVEQWCNVDFGESNASPLQSTSLPVNLYIGDSKTPATEIEVPNSVTTIPSYAFRYTTITSFSAPGAETIGEYAFYYCTSLSSVSLPAATSIGRSAFSSCSSLSSVSLPAATSIGSYAFQSCSSLSSISLPAATSIGEAAFYSCSKINSLRIGSVEQWCNVNFVGFCASPLQEISLPVNLYIGDSKTPATEIEVPSSITKIPDYAFRYTTITSFSAPGAETIGSSAFYNCTSLSSVELPASTSIGSWAFYNCTSLSSVSLPAATSIGSWAFYNCTSLSSVSLPAATSIGSYAFYLCSKINSLRIGSVEQWCNVNFGDYSSPLQETSLPVNLYIGDSKTPATEIEVPNSVTTIPDYAFRYTTITSFSAPGAETIGSYAFSGCESLEEAIMPKIKIIEDYAFGCENSYNERCKSLKRVDLSSVTSIGAKAFYYCNSLDIVHLNDTPPTLASTESFPTWTMLAVPDEKYEIYLATDVYREIPLQITKEGRILKEVEIEAENATSNLLQKIGEDEVKYVVNLKISGTINSYDMLIIRNQMPSLRNLDLSGASIVDCDYVYSNADGVDYHSQKDVVTGEWLKNVMNVKLPATAKSIGSRTFYNNTNLVNVEIPYGVTSISEAAFYGCNRIKELTLPQSVTSFGSYAFYDCTGLKEVVIPDGVTSVGNHAFYYCTDLEKVTIPASVTSIGSSAFNVNKPLELHVSSLESWLNVQNSNNTFNKVAKLYIGDSEDPVEEIVIPEGTTTLKNYAFVGFRCLKNVALPSTLSSIGEYAFQKCSNLTDIILPESLTKIGSYAFDGCSQFEKIELPPYLKTIGRYAFQNCSKLTEMLIPASIQEIGDYAFSGCPNLNTVIATTVEPVKINQNTFSTYQTATLYSPKTSFYKYYWNTQYNQFLAKKEYDKEFSETFGYKYFYLNGVNGDEMQDFEISDETGTIHGETDEATGEEVAPDADFNEGAGVIVGGEQIQNLGDIHIHHNGNNGASVIAKNSGKVHIDNLYVDIKVQKNRWYFFCFPFDINPGEATFDGSYVWYLYDGEARARNGNGGWKKIAAEGVMKSGNGYIFQGAVNGTLTIHVTDINIDSNDNSTNMITYQSDNKNDASWNLIGNSNFAYYDMANLSYDAPITVYNNSTGNYDAVRPGDDDYEFYPFQAFFVQKPESTESMNFNNAHKETKNKSDENKAKKAAARAKAPKKVNPMRKVINLELTSGDVVAEAATAPYDRTRIVVNPTKSTSYETDCDAAKFIADDMPQIYSLDNEGAMYSINERPVGNGIINLAVKAPKDGVFTITAARLDCAAKLRDLETGTEVDLAEGGYTFAAEAGTFANRFQLILADGATAITTPEEAKAAISVEAGAISVNDANADVKIYSVGGALVGSQKGAGSINVPTGAYVVKVNGQSVKVTVNE